MTWKLGSYALLLAWLAVVWVLLWGALTPAVLLSALLVSPLCLAACRLPAVPRTTRPRWRLIPLEIGRFAVDVVVSSAEVAWATVRRGPRVKSAIVAVPFDCPSDALAALAANRLSLVPGTLVVDIDPAGGKLYVYVFDVTRLAQLEPAREDAARGTSELIHAFGGAPGTPREGGRP